MVFYTLALVSLHTCDVGSADHMEWLNQQYLVALPWGLTRTPGWAAVFVGMSFGLSGGGGRMCYPA